MSNLSLDEPFILDKHGNIEFTLQGYRELKSLFAKANIDIRSIKTYSDYLIARRESSPYFSEWLCDQIETHKIDDAAKELFMDLITNDQFDLKDAMARYKRQQFKLIKTDNAEENC
jgi:hypothetical protein